MLPERESEKSEKSSQRIEKRCHCHSTKLREPGTLAKRERRICAPKTPRRAASNLIQEQARPPPCCVVKTCRPIKSSRAPLRRNRLWVWCWRTREKPQSAARDAVRAREPRRTREKPQPTARDAVRAREPRLAGLWAGRPMDVGRRGERCASQTHI